MVGAKPIEANSIADLVTLRWQELQKQGWTVYKLAQEFGKLREGESFLQSKRYNRYCTTVEKAIKNPLSARADTLELLKMAMGIQTNYAILEKREVRLTA